MASCGQSPGTRNSSGGRPLGLIAGAGSLPRAVIKAAQSAGRPILVVAGPGQADAETLAMAPSFVTPLGKVGAIRKRLRAEGIEDIVMAGSVRRPSLREVRPDWLAAKLIAQAGYRAMGDDGVLRAIIKAVEGLGFKVLSVTDVIENPFIEAGVLGRHEPNAMAEADILRGVAVVRALGAVDVGQAAVVQQGIVLGVEAIEGTDELIRRSGQLKRKGPGPVLVKLRKLGQEERVDLPTIGPRTVESAKAAGFSGIAAEAGGCLLLDAEEVRQQADKVGLFVVGVDAAHGAAEAAAPLPAGY